jgi:flagellar biosynthesis GTPase FlhF
MRIKSYFAPSVQSAISIARKEFGDEVTLVTSHTAALESRHLGDYEVVFAVEEPAEIEKTSTQIIKAGQSDQSHERSDWSAPTFTEVLEATIAVPLSTEQNLPGKLSQVETLLVEMGIDGPMVRALMTMIERTAAAPSPIVAAAETAAITVEETTAPEPEANVSDVPADLTPAERAFYLSVSVGA